MLSVQNSTNTNTCGEIPTYFKRAPLGPYVRTWVMKNQSTVLYSVADALICLSRSAGCFRCASQHTQFAKDYESKGYILWEYSIQVLKQAYDMDIETYVYHHLYLIHVLNNDNALALAEKNKSRSYGESAFYKKGLCRHSTPEERCQAIYISMRQLCFANQASYAESFGLLNQSVVMLHHVAQLADNALVHQDMQKVLKLWQNGIEALRIATSQENVRRYVQQFLSKEHDLNFGKSDFHETSKTTLLEKCDDITFEMKSLAPVQFVLVYPSTNLRSRAQLDEDFSFTQEWVYRNKYVAMMTLDTDGKFTQIDHCVTQCSTWEARVIDGWQVALCESSVESKRELLWKLFSNATNTVIWLDAMNTHLDNANVSVSIEEFEDYLKDYNVKVDISTTIPSIILEKKRYPSKMHHSVWLDKDSWTATLVSKGQSFVTIFKTLNTMIPGHAQIVYEGVRNHEYFIEAIHLTGDASSCDGKIEVRPFNLNGIRAKTKTFEIPKIDIVNLITQFNGKEINFNPLGGAFYDHHIFFGNCLDWAVVGMHWLKVYLPAPDVATNPDLYIQSLNLDFRDPNWDEFLASIITGDLDKVLGSKNH